MLFSSWFSKFNLTFSIANRKIVYYYSSGLLLFSWKLRITTYLVPDCIIVIRFSMFITFFNTFMKTNYYKINTAPLLQAQASSQLEPVCTLTHLGIIWIHTYFQIQSSLIQTTSYRRMSKKEASWRSCLLVGGPETV